MMDWDPLIQMARIIAPGAAAAVGVAAIATLALRKLLPDGAAMRYAAPLAMAVAVLSGYALLSEEWPLAPERHWHWIPYLVAAAAVAPIALARGVASPERWFLWLVLAAAAGSVITPTWTSLEDSRPYYIAGFAVGATLLAVLIEPLAGRPAGRFLPWILAGSNAMIAAALVIFIALLYGFVALVVAASLAGCALGTIRWAGGEPARGLAPMYALAASGLALVGHLDSFLPLQAIFLLPLAPLALWSCAAGPLSRLTGLAAAAVQFGVVILFSSLGMALMWVGERYGQ
jgi:hypothetical protein